VLLLRNKDQEYNNPLASFAICICRERIGHERTATAHLRKHFGGLEVTTFPWWASRSFIRPCLHA